MIRLVLVDDHELVREGLKTILRGEPDFDITGEAGTASGLMELVEKNPPDIVLLDARLPDASGPAICRSLSAAHPEVKVLIVSSYSDQDLVDGCLREGARGYVIKDIERFSLKQSVRAVHRGEVVLSPSIAGRIVDRLRSLDGAPAPNRLNSSQIRILQLMGQGLSNREIAAQVHLSENTVKSHVQEIFQKLGVHNRVEAALRAVRDGLI
jgi:two-component system, NarL family, response regulator DevR